MRAFIVDLLLVSVAWLIVQSPVYISVMLFNFFFFVFLLLSMAIAEDWMFSLMWKWRQISSGVWSLVHWLRYEWHCRRAPVAETPMMRFDVWSVIIGCPIGQSVSSVCRHCHISLNHFLSSFVLFSVFHLSFHSYHCPSWLTTPLIE